MGKIAIAATALAILAVIRSIVLKQRARNALLKRLATESGEDLTVRSCSVFADYSSVRAALAASLSVVYLEAFKDLGPKGMIRNIYEVSCNPITGRVRDISMLNPKT